MSFIIVAGLIIIVSTLCGANLIGKSKSDQKAGMIKSVRMDLQSYVNFSEEYRVKEYISMNPKIYDDLNDDLVFIFGDEYRNIFDLFSSGKSKLTGRYDKELEKKIVQTLLLSHKGMIHHDMLGTNIHVYNSELNPLLGIQLMRYAQIVEHNLQRKHPLDNNIMLFFEPQLTQDKKFMISNGWVVGNFRWKYIWFCDDRIVVRPWNEQGDSTLIKFIISEMSAKSGKMFPYKLWF